ncbi:hypothetical protein BC827DRAFT_1302697 [Russula dissimulans]|nr:hypothetical protein BC827DRAFT_1302697 [Russula dissimulans]
MSDEITRFLCNCASEVCGKLKTAARKFVLGAYGLSKSNSDDTNCTIAATLLSKNNFLYKDITTHEGYLLTQVLPDIINDMWFNHKQDDGVTFTSNFGNDGTGIPIKMIALVCMVIKNCINEYQAGAYKEIAFSGSSYKSRYLVHVGYFEDFVRTRLSLSKRRLILLSKSKGKPYKGVTYLSLLKQRLK